MTGYHIRYMPPTPYRPWSFVGYWAFRDDGLPVCLSYWFIDPEAET